MRTRAWVAAALVLVLAGCTGRTRSAVELSFDYSSIRMKRASSAFEGCMAGWARFASERQRVIEYTKRAAARRESLILVEAGGEPHEPTYGYVLVIGGDLVRSLLRATPEHVALSPSLASAVRGALAHRGGFVTSEKGAESTGSGYLCLLTSVFDGSRVEQFGTVLGAYGFVEVGGTERDVLEPMVEHLEESELWK